MNKPYFLWDYDISEKEVKRIIKQGDEYSREFIIARILESAKYKDVWKYITLEELVKVFPRLKLKKEIKQAWQNAFLAWKINF